MGELPTSGNVSERDLPKEGRLILNVNSTVIFLLPGADVV